MNDKHAAGAAIKADPKTTHAAKHVAKPADPVAAVGPPAPAVVAGVTTVEEHAIVAREANVKVERAERDLAEAKADAATKTAMVQAATVVAAGGATEDAGKVRLGGYAPTI